MRLLLALLCVLLPGVALAQAIPLPRPRPPMPPVWVEPLSFRDAKVAAALGQAKTIFVNAVMGFTPHFSEGSAALDETFDQNRGAMKLYGGGDTLQEFKNLCPGLSLSVLDNARYYFFTGGGTVLTAIEKGSAYSLGPVQALIANAGRAPA